MNLLIIGCGSIGSRHARNAKTLGHDVILCDPNPERGQYTDYKIALDKEHIDAAIVASPSNLHVEQALYLAEKDVPIFMEKPLATSLNGLKELVHTVRENKVVTMMGQSYRWHEGLLKLKAQIEGGIIGKVLRVKYISKEYLPNWHPTQDYRKEYAAQKSMGGGALFTSMSHTLDFIELLLGTIIEVNGRKERLGDLEIDVDDTATVSGKTDRNIKFDAHNDYISKIPSHTLRVSGKLGEAVLNMTTNTLNGETYSFEPNHRYVGELRHFIRLVETNTPDSSIDLAHGAHIVELMCDKRIKDLTIE